MIQSVADISNKKALKLFQDLDLVKLIKVNQKKVVHMSIRPSLKKKMSKLSFAEIDSQLSALRNG